MQPPAISYRLKFSPCPCAGSASPTGGNFVWGRRSRGLYTVPTIKVGSRPALDQSSLCHSEQRLPVVKPVTARRWEIIRLALKRKL